MNHSRIFLSVMFVFMACLYSCNQAQKEEMDLSGEWLFALDPDDEGISGQWYNRTLEEKIHLPGSLQEQGFGHDVGLHTRWTGQIVDSAWFKADEYKKYRQEGNIKIPFWLQPEKHYVGVAWYQKEITIPGSWKNRWVELELERTHWETTLYVNGTEVGKNNSLQTPHRYRVSQTGKVILTVRVDNRVHIPVGINAHSVSDHTQSNWNGLVGNIVLRSRPALYIDHARVYPDLKNQKAKVVISVSGDSQEETAGITLRARCYGNDVRTTVKPVSISRDRTVTVDIDLGDQMLTWSEFEPNVYDLDIELDSESGRDMYRTTFGMREFKAHGTRFTVNGTPVFLRGTLECAIFPLTGYPSTDAAYWKKIYRQCKAFGLNHVRFHSWCPPRVAFEVADREGIYLQVECGGWAHVGDGGMIDQWFIDESERIVREYGNHPSFCLMAYGNEPDGAGQAAYLSGFVDHWKAKDPRRVYTSAAGWPYVPNADYWNTPDPRIQYWGAGLKSLINANHPTTGYDFRAIIRSTPMPVVSHEIGQWCVYPNFKETSKYTGVLKPRNFEFFEETLSEHHMGDLSEQFLYASGRLQTLCYKADIEAALRTPGFAGFQLLDLHDFPGQGTALVGVLDPFWDTKGYVDGKEYSSFCNRTVPLARIPKMVWTNDEVFKAALEVSHFGEHPVRMATVQWSVTDHSGNVIATGSSTKDLPIDNCIHISDIEYNLSQVSEPSSLKLVASVSCPGEDHIYTNEWDFWVYPAKPESAGKPYITSNYNDAVAKAGAGKNVLFCIPADAIKPGKGGNIPVGFSSIFWNTAWSRKQAPHTLGIYCNPNHPALGLFPNKGYSEYQWWDIVAYSTAMVLDDFPPAYQPVVHLIDDWFTNRKLGILLETKVGAGKMMVCSVDLTRDMDKRPAARQFQHSIEQYMISDKFNPATELDLPVLRDLLK